MLLSRRPPDELKIHTLSLSPANYGINNNILTLVSYLNIENENIAEVGKRSFDNKS